MKEFAIAVDELKGLIGEHRCLIAYLSDAIKHKYPLDADVISKDDHCKIGKFLYAPETTKCFGKFSHFKEVVLLHKRFHLEMSEAAKMENDSEYAKASAMIDESTRFCGTSSMLIASVIQLEKEIDAFLLVKNKDKVFER